MMIRDRIEEAVRRVVGDARFVVERPADLSHGDYSTNAALVTKTDPHEIVAKLGSIEGVERVEVAGRFINFYLSRDALTPGKQEVPQLRAGTKVLVEYTDPNPFKEFHIGHLMSNAIGESIARLLGATGADVKKANYQGDVGPHVAKAIWGRIHTPELSWGEAYTYGNNEYEAHKEEIDTINRQVYEQSDATVVALYNTGRTESLAHFEEIYKKLGTQFDYYFFESDTGPRGAAIVKANPELFVESEGAVVFHGGHTRVFLTSKGLPTYEAKDLGLLELKKETLSVDMSVTVTASEQKEYLKVVLEAAARIPAIADIAAKTKHITHGMMRFASGKMSSRKGNVITGESLLQDLISEAKEKMHGRELKDADKTAEQIAVGAIKYAVLKQGSSKDIVFDPEKSLSLEGDSGPYLQYAHMRALSLLRAAKEAGVTSKTDDKPAHAGVLERVLVHYPEVVARAATELEPHYVTTYLTELAGAFNSWYASERVIGGPHPHYGVYLATAFERTMAHGLNVLGIPAPEEM